MFELDKLFFVALGAVYVFTSIVYIHFFSEYRVKKPMVAFVYALYAFTAIGIFVGVSFLPFDFGKSFIFALSIVVVIFTLLYKSISVDRFFPVILIEAIQTLPIIIITVLCFLLSRLFVVDNQWLGAAIYFGEFIVLSLIAGAPLFKMHSAARRFFNDLRRGEVLIAVCFLLFDFGIFVLLFVGQLFIYFATASLVAIGILCVAVEMIVFYNYALQKRYSEAVSAKLEKENAERALKVWKANFEVMEKATEQSRRYKHDLRHNYLILAGMIQQGETQKALDFIAEMGISVEEIQPVQYCKNTSVNSILASYLSLAESKNIRTSVRAVVPSNLAIDDVELSGIFANALENAIEACDHIAKNRTPYITVECDHRHSKLFINIKNSCRADIEFDEDELPRSNKPGGGRGTLIIKSVVEKHHGLCRFFASSGVFHTQVILNVPRT